MDALTFGSTVLLRRLTMSEARKLPVQEFHVDKVLTDMGLTNEEVINIKNNFHLLINIYILILYL